MNSIQNLRFEDSTSRDLHSNGYDDEEVTNLALEELDSVEDNYNSPDPKRQTSFKVAAK